MRTKSVPRGDDTSHAEVSGISAHGIWLLLGSRELFLAFKDFPWFRKAPIGGVLRVERPQPHHLYWPELDIDLDVESILDPPRFPLVSREKLRSARGRLPAKGNSKERPAAGRRKSSR